MSSTNSAAAVEGDLKNHEKTPEEAKKEFTCKDWSMGNFFLKFYLGALLGGYLVIGMLSGHWRLTEGQLFDGSYLTPFYIGVFVAPIKCLEYHAFGFQKEKTLCFWGTVAFQFCWGVGCLFMQPYFGKGTWCGNDTVWLGSAVAFTMGTLMILSYLVKKMF